MAQDFESVGKRNISNTQTISGATTIVTSDSDDAIIGINAANTGSSQILVSVLITDSSNTASNTFFIVKVHLSLREVRCRLLMVAQRLYCKMETF